jgi:DNA processing protein
VDDPRIYWVGFNIVKGIGPARLRALLAFFGDVESAWSASPAALEASGLSPKLVEALLQVRTGDALQRTWERIEALGITVLTWDDPAYPRRLKDIDQSPPVLYARGKLVDDDEWAVAIVGTRRFTSYGRQVATALATAMAHNGVTVVSGLARGIDAVAHLAALDAGGRTIAVLGSGVDRIYPPEHRNLAERIVENGAVLSDYSPGTAPEGINFPPRNRIISGLSQAVVVVEAGKRSGALITAAYAAEQGREVFAVPNGIYAPQSKGTNTLLGEGAQILLKPEDLLETLNLGQIAQHRTARAALPADATEARLYALLGREPLHVDDLRAQSELPIEQVSAALTVMELKGLVRQVGSMRYIAVHEPQGEYRVGPDGAISYQGDR